jgi:hypothetical protein
MKKISLLFFLFITSNLLFASFPVVNETAEIINQAYFTPWYNKWWAILLEIIIFPIGLVRLLYWAYKYDKARGKIKPWKEKSLASKILFLIGLAVIIILVGVYISFGAVGGMMGV